MHHGSLKPGGRDIALPTPCAQVPRAACGFPHLETVHRIARQDRRLALPAENIRRIPAVRLLKVV